MTFEINFR